MRYALSWSPRRALLSRFACSIPRERRCVARNAELLMVDLFFVAIDFARQSWRGQICARVEMYCCFLIPFVVLGRLRPRTAGCGAIERSVADRFVSCSAPPVSLDLYCFLRPTKSQQLIVVPARPRGRSCLFSPHGRVAAQALCSLERLELRHSTDGRRSYPGGARRLLASTDARFNHGGI